MKTSYKITDAEEGVIQRNQDGTRQVFGGWVWWIDNKTTERKLLSYGR